MLTALDEQMAQPGLCYVRDMDDILLMAPTRWKLRRAIRGVKQGLAEMGLRTHPDNTWVEQSERGCDFLEYRVSREEITVAKATLTQYLTRQRRLDEQERGKPSRSSPLRVYFSGWWRWAEGGLPDLQTLASSLGPPIASQA